MADGGTLRTADIQPYKHSIVPYDAAIHGYQTCELTCKIARV